MLLRWSFEMMRLPSCVCAWSLDGVRDQRHNSAEQGDAKWRWHRMVDCAGRLCRHHDRVKLGSDWLSRARQLLILVLHLGEGYNVQDRVRPTMTEASSSDYVKELMDALSGHHPIWLFLTIVAVVSIIRADRIIGASIAAWKTYTTTQQRLRHSELKFRLKSKKAEEEC